MFWPYSAYYTARIGRNADTNCVYSGDEDTADHTVFHCPRWAFERTRAESTLEVRLTPENFTNTMIDRSVTL